MILHCIKISIYPTLKIHAIPDLLDLLASIEWYRHRALSAARSALVWNTYYRNDPAVPTLSDEEESVLRAIENKNKSWRMVYITTLCCLCKLVSLAIVFVAFHFGPQKKLKLRTTSAPVPPMDSEPTFPHELHGTLQ